jgi:hypothetical protein
MVDGTRQKRFHRDDSKSNDELPGLKRMQYQQPKQPLPNKGKVRPINPKARAYGIGVANLTLDRAVVVIDGMTI